MTKDIKDIQELVTKIYNNLELFEIYEEIISVIFEYYSYNPLGEYYTFTLNKDVAEKNNKKIRRN